MKVGVIPPKALESSFILDDQSDHVVVAVRVPREAIRDNHALLACLSDRAAGKPPPRRAELPAMLAPPLAPVRRTSTKKIALWSFLGVFAGAGAGGFAVFGPAKAVPEPPIKNFQVFVPNPVLAPSEPLVITFTTRRARLCKTDVERIILNDRNVTVFTARQAGIGQAISETPITRKVRVPLPDGLEPGHYTYRANMFSDCGAGDVWVEPTPDLAFEIVR